MDRLRALQVFKEVVRCGSFVRAASQLALSKATITKHVAWLEASMGAQLLNRSARQMSLTEAGYRVLDAASQLLDRYETMESDVRDSVKLPRGGIRIGTPPSFGTHHLMGVLTQFSKRYPDIEVTLVVDDGSLDLVSEALDLSIRIAPSLQDASFIAQSLMKSPQVMVAAPAYLRQYGVPRSVHDLTRHNCLVHTVKSSSGIWRFSGAEPAEVRVRGSLRANLGDALKQAALQGAGISIHPDYMVSEELRNGTLVAVLPGCVPEEMDICIVFPSRRHMPVRVRHLLEYIKDWSRQPPQWSAPVCEQVTQRKARTSNTAGRAKHQLTPP